jgi:hypothetical protein
MEQLTQDDLWSGFLIDMPPNPYQARAVNALQRTRRERRGCNPRVPCAGSLSLGRSAASQHLV